MEYIIKYTPNYNRKIDDLIFENYEKFELKNLIINTSNQTKKPTFLSFQILLTYFYNIVVPQLYLFY